MTTIIARRRPVCLALAGTALFVWAIPCPAQNPQLPPTYGTLTLKAGFTPDPQFVDLFAGGPILTERSGVSAYVANAPNFQLNYTAGSRVLTFYTESAAGTTLLIRLPDGSWVAEVNSFGSFNPMVRIVH